MARLKVIIVSDSKGYLQKEGVGDAWLSSSGAGPSLLTDHKLTVNITIYFCVIIILYPYPVQS